MVWNTQDFGGKEHGNIESPTNYGISYFKTFHPVT